MAEPRKRQPESPKRFMQQVLQRGPYFELLQILQKNPNFGVSGRVVRTNHHYVHEHSTSVELEAEGYFGSGDEEDEAAGAERAAREEAAHKLVESVREDLQERVRATNKDITKNLYEELEHYQSDQTLTEWMNDNDWRFDQEGEKVDMADFVPVDNLEPETRQKVLQDYADLFDRSPDQVYTVLMQRQLRFDHWGNRVDVTKFRKISDLEPAMRAKILDKYRDILVEDNWWTEGSIDWWKEKLEAQGFDLVEISYSLGYSQGDGASFTSDSIDAQKLCKSMLGLSTTESQAVLLVSAVLQ